MSTTTSLSRNSSIHWILDWDGTLTQKDTLDALVNIAASSKPNTNPPILDRWKSVVDAYMADYTSELEKLAPNGALPTTIEGEKKLLKAMEVVEHRSLQRVLEAQIFEGVTKEHIESGAQNAIEKGDVTLRPGVKRFLEKVQAHGDKIHILSVNWSRHFIHSCLAACGTSLDTSLVLANELDGIAEGASSNGRITPKIVSSSDKLRELKKLRDTSPALIVYAGDSWPDIECLLAADVGICIRDEEMSGGQGKLAERLEGLGIEVERLREGSEGVVWVGGLGEVGEWVEGRGEGGV